MDFSSDAVSDLTASKRILFAGVVGLVALKVVSACFHNYQLYEVDRLVQHIAHSAEMERRRRSAVPCAATPMLHASQPSASASSTQGGGTTAVTPRRSSSVRNGDASTLPEVSMVGQKMVEDGAWQDMSAHSHDISTAPLNAALDEEALPAPLPLPPPPTTTTNAADTHGGTCRASVDSATSSQPLLRNTSGICITAVHLVGGEPAPSTSQLLSRLSFAGSRSVASPSLAAAHARGDAGAASSASSPSVSPRDDFSPSTETGAAFSVVRVDTAACSTPRDAAGVADASVTEVVRGDDTAASAAASASCVVHEVEVGSGFADGATGPPVIIYAPVETAATSDSTEGLLLHAPNAPPAVDPNVGVTAASTHEKLSPCVAAEEAEGEDTSVASPLPYFSFTTTSVHIAKADVTSHTGIESTANTEGAEESVNRTEEGITSSAVPGAAAAAAATSSRLAASSTSNYVSNPAGLSGAAVYVPALSPLLCDAVAVESTGRSASVVSAATTTAASAAAQPSLPPRPMVHLFIQPRWALAPSLSPSCTKWETFLRLHHVSYTVHEVHVLRGDQPQAQSSDVPQQIRHEVERRRKAGAGDDDAAAAEARAFADALAEVTVTQRVWGRLEAGLRRVLPAGVLPGDRRTQYALPFMMVGGAVLQGSFADVAAELTKRGLIRPSLTSSPTAPAPQNGADESSRHSSGTRASASYTPEEQRAIGQAVERTAEYTLRLLYEVGLLLEGCAVFSHYAAQLWSGHRYWDVLQIRRWFVYAWLALPFLSALKEDVQRGLRAHELGGLTREQLYRSLQSDLVSLEQLLVASADASGASDPDAAASAVHFLLGREPGPQDCALYAYLLPILRLTPSDIAHIRNPNFTYIYESSIFRAFVQHMTAAAFPDLDVLLRPPRKPSFVVSLSAVVYDHVEARTTPMLVEVHRQLHRLVASAGRWLTPCHAAFLCCVSSVLASTPARQARCTLRRLAHRCQGLVPVRPTPADRQPTASTSRRQCTQAWWHFLDFSKTSRQSGAGERDDLSSLRGETSVATQRAGNSGGGGSSGSTVLPRAILDSVRVNDGREDAAVGGSPVTTSAPLVVARRRSYVDSGTQVTESLEDLAALARGVQVGEETREEEDAVRVPSPVPTPAALPKEEEEGNAAEAQQLSVSEKFGETGMMRSGGVAEEEKSVAKSPPQLLRATDVEPPKEIAGDAAAAVGVAPLRDLSAPVVVETPALQLVEEAPGAEPSVEPAMGLLPMPPLLQQQPPQQHESTPSPAPVSPRVVHELVAAPANTHTAAAAHGNDTSGDSPLTSTRSEDNTDVIAASSSSIASSPTAARREGSRIARSATATSAPSPRAATAGSPTAATSHDAVPPRFTVDRVSAARTISRSLASPVEPRHSLAETKRRPSPGPRLRSSSTAEARPTTAKAGDSGNTGNAASSPVAVAALRVPRGQAVTAAAATGASPPSIASVDEDDASETSSITTAETASERRVSYTRSTSIARSSTAATHTPTRQRRPSGLSPGLFTTVVNRKVYLTDGREHPSWSVEPRRRSSSATASGTETRAGGSSPTPSSRRGSLVDGGGAVGGRDGARSPVPSGSVGRTVTPIRKTRPSPAGRSAA